MLDSITNVVRSNQNGIMIRVGNGNADTAIYTIFDLKTQTNTFTGNGEAGRSYWNRNYRNSRQFSTPNGANHRFMS